MPGAGDQPPQRTTFRPPWVKDGPPPIPMPTAPWTLNSRRDSRPTTEEAPAFTKVTLKSVPKPADAKVDEAKSATTDDSRKMSKIVIVPSQPKSDKNAGRPSAPAPSKARENGRSEPSSRPQLERQVRVEKSRSRGDQIPLSKSESTTGAPTLSKSASRANLPPPPPPRPPPPPPARAILKDIPPLSDKQLKTLEMLKSRPRKRPDWACMMKEVESGRKLRHITCNDRSAPLIERVITKVTADPAGDAHFVFDSEKSNVHNKLLKQIQEGVKLKKVQTNDRSKPMLQGLRKFRRQLTIEEQMQKAEQAPVDEVIPDEMDDIDAVRDDLQSTKQMLALELRNKEALERDNKRLQARILNLEVELERECSQKSQQEGKQPEQKLSESLKKEAEQARKHAERLEKDFAVAAEEKDKAKTELEEMKRMYANLEKRMKAGMALAGCPSSKDVARIASQKSMDKSELEDSEEDEEETSEEESEDEDPKVMEEKRQQRDIKFMKTKITNFKDKTVNSKKERQVLKGQIKQQQQLLKEEQKKMKALQKEVDKMAKLMADADEDDKEEEDNEEEVSESEEESESEESEDDEDSETDDESAPIEQRKNKLQKRVNRHEGRLAALKKGNYLLKAQADRLKDDLTKQREESITLQEDLDSVLAELG